MDKVKNIIIFLGHCPRYYISGTWTTIKAILPTTTGTVPLCTICEEIWQCAWKARNFCRIWIVRMKTRLPAHNFTILHKFMFWHISIWMHTQREVVTNGAAQHTKCTQLSSIITLVNSIEVTRGNISFMTERAHKYSSGLKHTPRKRQSHQSSINDGLSRHSLPGDKEN